MPRGRGFGRSRRWGAYGSWFLKLLLLLFIRLQPSHGYELAAQLAPFGFTIQGRGGMGPIYRILRELEMEGLITSSWETPVHIGGPARRIYTITPVGEEALKLWIAELKEQKEMIENILKLYEK